MAVLISLDKYKALNNMLKGSVKDMYKDHNNPDISEDQADELANQVKHLARKNK